MEILRDLVSILWPIIAAYLIYIHKRLYDMSKKLNNTLTKGETEHLIDLKNLPSQILERETAQNIKEIKQKLDKLNDRLLNSK